MNAEKVVVFPGVHEVLVDERARSDDARDSPSVLQLPLGLFRRIVQELVTNGDMLVEVLD